MRSILNVYIAKNIAELILLNFIKSGEHATRKRGVMDIWEVLYYPLFMNLLLRSICLLSGLKKLLKKDGIN